MRVDQFHNTLDALGTGRGLTALGWEIHALYDRTPDSADGLKRALARSAGRA